jgi:hypothetical protein
MTHQDKGHYAEKHSGKKIDEKIAGKIKALADHNNLTCAAAHSIAKDLGISPLEIGVQTDLLEFRISRCQLGLFGYSPEKKRINPDIQVSKELGDQLDKVIIENKISCSQSWEIAGALKIKRLDMGSACEKKGVRIKPCQLGAF